MQNLSNLVVFPFTKTPWQSTLQITRLPTSPSHDYPIQSQPFCLPKTLPNFTHLIWQNMENQQVNWLITYFNQWFTHRETLLINGIKIGKTEPEYFAKADTQPAQIIFAHGFFCQ